MFVITPQHVLRAYQQGGLDTDVYAASPHGLIQLLLDGAITAIVQAQGHLARHDVADKGMAISRAISMLEELRQSLDHTTGGALATNLHALYDYMIRQLLTANLMNQPELLEAVISLLSDLRSAWAAIAPR